MYLLTAPTDLNLLILCTYCPFVKVKNSLILLIKHVGHRQVDRPKDIVTFRGANCSSRLLNAYPCHEQKNVWTYVVSAQKDHLFWKFPLYISTQQQKNPKLL